MRTEEYQISREGQPLFALQAEIAMVRLAIPIARAARGIGEWCRRNEPALRKWRDQLTNRK